MKFHYAGRVFSFLVIFSMLLSAVGVPAFQASATTVNFTAEELLGKPTNNSITINIVPASAIEYKYEYGTTSGAPYSNSTTPMTAAAGQPSEVTLTGLSANTHYYYRMVYDGDGDIDDGDFETRTEHSFWTQRTPGSSFYFTVTSDWHAQYNTNSQNVSTNIMNEVPDFEIDLGDTPYPAQGTTSQTAVNNAYLALREPLYMDKFGHSTPIFLTPGNHEEEEGWNLDDSFSIGVASIQARKAYFPTPQNSAFYSGNTDPLAAIDQATYGDEMREDYYAWTWGDALFVVIDVFEYTMSLPYTPAAGEGTDDTKTCIYSGDTQCQWNWTLGAAQYSWLKNTLQNSTAKYKFVFSHNMAGGIPSGSISGAEAGYVRGGAEAAGYFEWGGKNYDGTEGFASHRSTGDFPQTIHQLFVNTGVSAYFHGHDHQYVYEKRGPVVYQEVPSPSMTGTGFDGIYYEGTYADYSTISRRASPGHLRIQVTPSQATVDLISGSNTSGTPTYTYNIAPNAPVTTYTLTTAVNPGAGGSINPAAGTTTYNEGTVVNVTATANTGYVLSSWSGTGACAGTTNPCPVTMDGNKTITANFTTVTTYTLTTAVSPSGGGTINPAPGTTTYNTGTNVSVTATANTGYTFTSWSGTGACSGTTNPCTVSMTGNRTITANFTAVTTYTLTTAASPSAGGTISPPTGPYNSGTVVNVTATANSGYAFSSWSGTGACAGTTNPCPVTMSAARSITANFVTAVAITFTGTELLGRPETDRISISCVPNTAATIRYGTSTTPGGPYTNSSSVVATAGQPAVVTITGLSANTRYYYRMEYSTDGGSTWTPRTEKSFWTKRATGSTFTFDITSDSHINIQLGNTSNWNSTMTKIAADVPDFQIDLGDTAAMDNGSTSVTLGDTAAAEQKYKDLLTYFNLASGSSPVFLTPGNHEQQEAWHLTASNVGGNPAISLPVMAKNAEKKYFLNPVNDSFYTGDTSTYSYLSGDQLKQDYFAWTWGDALFVVISPFWTTTTKPYTTLTGGGETDSTGSDNRWDWTLGLTQFNWLKATLQGSSAKYKFIFSHQIVGGDSASSMVNYGHGGVNSADLVEWGGFDVGTTNNTWSTNRSGWGSQPIRQMMEANGVTAFFHGHDHQMAYEKYNSIVYQSVPSGSFTGSFGIYTTGGLSGRTIYADSTQGPGYLRVTVGPSQTNVEFIRYNGASAAYSYTMAPNATATYALTVSKPGAGSGTVTSNPAGIDCGSTCSANFTASSVVSLTAVASTGSTFNSWGGACSGTGTCNVTMDAVKSVTATFTLNTYTLTVSKTGTGSGTVTSTPAGIACGSTCSASFNYNTSVSLSASPSAGSTFTSWGGVCSGNGACNVTMDAAKSVTATFTSTAAAPVAANDSYTAEEGHTMIIDAPGVLGNDTDSNNDPLTASKVTDPSHGTVTLNSNGSFTYIPTAGYEGADSFTYRAYDGGLYSGNATVTITVIESAPVIVPSSYYGYVSVTPAAAAGDYVEAYVSGRAGYVARTAIVAGTPLQYSMDVPGDIAATSMVEGGTSGGVVTFKINGRVVGTGTWQSGSSTRLDFTSTLKSISLVVGWNLVSFNLHPASTAILDVLTSVAGNYSLVYAWNATSGSWMKYDTVAPPFSNTLSTLDETQGFWIKITTADTLEVSGSAPTTSNIALKTGWNLVGYPKTGTLVLPDVFSLHGVGTDFTLVYAYHAAEADQWKKFDRTAEPYVNDLTQLAPDYGYWIKVGGPHTWDVTY